MSSRLENRDRWSLRSQFFAPRTIRPRRPSRAVGDTIGNADATKAAAGHEKPGVARERAIDCRDRVQMADLVLRVGAIPAVDAVEDGSPAIRAADATASIDRAISSSSDSSIAHGSRAPPTKVAHEHAVLRCAARPLRRQPGRRQKPASRRAAPRNPIRSAGERSRRAGTRAQPWPSIHRG